MKPQKHIRSIVILLVTLTLAIWCTTLALPSTAPSREENFSLSVTIKSRHTAHFQACIPIRVEEPFRVVWGNDKVKDRFSGVLHAAKDQKYAITLNISEGNGSCREMTEPRLTLDQAENWSNIVSLAFQHIDSREVILSKGRCQQQPAEEARSR